MDLFLTAKKPNVHVRHKSMAAENIGNWYYKYVYDMYSKVYCMGK